MIYSLLLSLFILLATYFIFKITLKAIRKVDIESELEERRDREGIFQKYTTDFTVEANKKAKEIKESVSSFTKDL